MPAAIFKGSKVKTLKDTFTVNDKYDLITGDSDDPTVVAKDAIIGSEYIRSTTGVKYKKNDNGLTTNWTAGNPAALNIKTQTTTANIAIGDDLTLADSTGGAYTLTLPAVAGNDGKILRIKKSTTDFSVITIDGNGAETINGGLTTTINTIGETLTLVVDEANTDWVILDRKIPSDWQNVTMTFSHTTNTTIDKMIMKRNGDTASFFYQLTYSGLPDAGTFVATIPAGLTIDGAKTSATVSNYSMGIGNFGTASGDYDMRVSWNSSTGMSAVFNKNFGAAPSTIFFSGFTNSNPTTIVSGDYLKMLAIAVPIVGWNG